MKAASSPQKKEPNERLFFIKVIVLYVIYVSWNVNLLCILVFFQN